MSHALFSGGQPTSAGGSRYLVEFKAGKMTLKDGWVRPSTRKGMVYVHQSDDGLMHFCWKDRSSGSVEDDLIIFPDDCEFKRITQCTTGRVYLLKFKSSSKKYFFWMQEPKEDKDAELCKKVNDSLNNPPTPGSNRAGGGGVGAGGGGGGGGGGLSSALSGLGESDISSMFGNISQSELMQLLQMGMQMGLNPAGVVRPSTGASEASDASALPSRVHSSPGVRRGGGVGGGGSSSSASAQPDVERPATAAPATAAASSQQHQAGGGSNRPESPRAGQRRPDGTRIQLSDLQTILSSIGGPQQQQQQQQQQRQQRQQQQQLDLTDMLTSEVVQQMLRDSRVRERLARHLPDSVDLPPVDDELRQSLQSPQFRQCAAAFAAALQTGELAGLVGHFGVGQAAVKAAEEGNLEAFVRAMQPQAGGEDAEMPQAEGGGEEGEKKKDEEKEKEDGKETAEKKKEGEEEEKMDES